MRLFNTINTSTRTNISLILLCLCCGETSRAVEQTPGSGQITAILGAFEREVTLIEDQLEQRQERMIEGIRFVNGILNGQKVVVTWTGVGKVNAAMTTTLLIEHYKPRYVIFTGIAGGVNTALEPGDIVIAEKTAQHDMGTIWPEGLFCKGVKSRLDGYENPVFFSADPQLLVAAEKAVDRAGLESMNTVKGKRNPKIMQGVVVTGDSFIASTDKRAELRKKLNADAVEMEGAAVAQICYQREIGYIVIRSISDNADEGAVLDKQTFYMMAARNSARLVAEMVGLLGAATKPAAEPQAK
ncbi:MAG: 5'-methylthioadenosine/adenosylhomocysteine nucleosidase [Phycisphaerales bacterium]|nr:MAG: 5'-methylthioadenosine/adenosylhomocysteine nucleosidase [Phycisphaerales bacterium]